MKKDCCCCFQSSVVVCKAVVGLLDTEEAEAEAVDAAAARIRDLVFPEFDSLRSCLSVCRTSRSALTKTLAHFGQL